MAKNRRNKEMKTYYKIVSKNTRFYDIAFINGIFYLEEIPKNMVFHAEAMICPGKYQIQNPQPVLHFCDSAFDTVLWTSKFDSWLMDQKTYFYKIVPLTEIIKQRCPDQHGLYQCGAYEIKFKELIDKNKMFKLAIKEYETDPSTKEQMYPNLDLVRIVQNWKYGFFPIDLYVR